MRKFLEFRPTKVSAHFLGGRWHEHRKVAGKWMCPGKLVPRGRAKGATQSANVAMATLALSVARPVATIRFDDTASSSKWEEIFMASSHIGAFHANDRKT